MERYKEGIQMRMLKFLLPDKNEVDKQIFELKVIDNKYAEYFQEGSVKTSLIIYELSSNFCFWGAVL